MTQPEPTAPSGAVEPAAPSGTGTGEGAPASPEPAPSGTTAQPAEDTVSKAEYDRVLKQLQGNDRQRQDLQNQLKAIQDKDLPELERLKRDAESVKVENERLKASLQQQAVELAFLRDNTVKWRDSAAALKLLDRAELQIGDDGSVSGVKIASEKLAKQYPFMVDEGTPAEPAPASSGKSAGGGVPPMNGKSGTSQSDTAGMVSRLPALASRRRPRSS